MSDKPSQPSDKTNWDPLLKHSSALGILKPGIVFSSSSGGYGSSSSSSSTGYPSSGSKTSGGSSYTSGQSGRSK